MRGLTGKLSCKISTCPITKTNSGMDRPFGTLGNHWHVLWSLKSVCVCVLVSERSASLCSSACAWQHGLKSDEQSRSECSFVWPRESSDDTELSCDCTVVCVSFSSDFTLSSLSYITIKAQNESLQKSRKTCNLGDLFLMVALKGQNTTFQETQ